MVLRKANTTAELGDQFALLVSGVVDYAIFMLDPAGRIVTWNEGAQRIKGYQAEEIIGRHFSVFYPAAETRIRKPDWELEVAKRDGRYEEEGWRIRKDGSRFWANVVITALRDETGRLRGFGKVTQEQIDVFRPLTTDHRFTLESDGTPMLVEGDRARIATVVANLIDNAVKYSPQGGEVACTVRNLGSQVVVTVSDEGIGIAPEHMATLFTRFGRLPTDENVGIPGTG